MFQTDVFLKWPEHAIFFILQWMNGMKRCGVLRQLANASEGYYIAIVFSSTQITVWWQEGLVCFAHKISIYLDLLHNFAEPWPTWCFTLSIRDVQLLRVHHSSLFQEKANNIGFLPCSFQKRDGQFPETKEKGRSRCCRHSMKIYLALRSTTVEKVQNYHKVTKTPRPNSTNKAGIQEVLDNEKSFN